jgi:hypothetical protein
MTTTMPYLTASLNPLLVACLAATRARLLCPLIGLDEATLQESAVILTRRHPFTWRAGQNEGQPQGSIKSWTQLGLPMPKWLLHFKGRYT